MYTVTIYYTQEPRTRQERACLWVHTLDRETKVKLILLLKYLEIIVFCKIVSQQILPI
jgi:hypothetical protein